MSPMMLMKNPFNWLQQISDYQATTSGGPNFAYDLCVRKISRDQVEALDLSRWDVAFCGAEPIRPATLQQFSEHFAPAGFRSGSFLPCYGMAETTLIVTGMEKGQGLRVADDAGWFVVGTPCPTPMSASWILSTTSRWLKGKVARSGCVDRVWPLGTGIIMPPRVKHSRRVC